MGVLAEYQINYFDLYDETHVKHKEIFFEEKCFSSCI